MNYGSKTAQYRSSNFKSEENDKTTNVSDSGQETFITTTTTTTSPATAINSANMMMMMMMNDNTYNNTNNTNSSIHGKYVSISEASIRHKLSEAYINLQDYR